MAGDGKQRVRRAAGCGETRARGIWKMGRGAASPGEKERHPATPCLREPSRMRTGMRTRILLGIGNHRHARQRGASAPIKDPHDGVGGTERRAGATLGHPCNLSEGRGLSLGPRGVLPWVLGAHPPPPPPRREQGRNSELSLLLCDMRSRPRSPETRGWPSPGRVLADLGQGLNGSIWAAPASGRGGAHGREGQTRDRPEGSRPDAPCAPAPAATESLPPGPGTASPSRGVPSSRPAVLATSVAVPGRFTNVSVSFPPRAD